MLEIFGAPKVSGIQGFEEVAGQTAGPAYFDFDEVFRREQEQRKHRPERDDAPKSESTREIVESRVEDPETSENTASTADSVETGKTSSVAVYASTLPVEEEVSEEFSTELFASGRSKENQGEAARFSFGTQTEMMAQKLEPGGVEPGLQPTQSNPLELLDFNELMDPDLVVEKAPTQIVTRLSQMVATSAPHLEELAEIVVPQVTRGFATIVRNGSAEMRLQLQPPDLGEIELRVRTTESAVRGHVVVQHGELKHLLEAQLDKLRDALAEQGLAMEGFDVSVGREGQFARNEEGSEARGGQLARQEDGVTTETIELNRPSPVLAQGAGNGDLDFIA